MPFKGMYTLPTMRLPHEEYSALSPAATRGQPPPIGAPGHTHHDSLMSRQLLLLRAIGRIPQRDGAIITPAGHPRAIRAPGYAPEPGRVRTICPSQGVCGHIPHLHSTLKGAAGQQLSVWTPRHTIEDGVSGVGVPNDLETGAQGWVPEPDVTIRPATSQPAPIRTPCHAVYTPAMTAQHASRPPTGHLPDGDQAIRTGTRQLRAVWTPVEVVEGGHGTLHDPHALRTFDLPQPQGAIVTTTEQVAALGGEGQAKHNGAMTLQHRPQCAELAIPQPDRCVPTATGQRASIRTPGQGFHPLRMSHQRLQTASTGGFPQLDGAIPARAGENAAVGGKGQAAHQVGMPGERLHAGCWLAVPDLPEPGRARDVATGEQAPIRAPGSREDRTGMRYVLHRRAQRSLPEPDGGIKSPTGEQASIGGKSQAQGDLRVPARPEQGTTRYVPQLDAAILASTGERVFIRAQGNGKCRVGMGLPDQVQELAFLAPHPHFPPPADGRPILPTTADGHFGDGIEGLRKDALTHHGPGQIRVLHLDPLHVRPPNGEP